MHLYIYAPLLFCPRSIKKFAAWWLRALDMSLTDECAKESWEVSSGLIPAYLLCTDTVEPVARGRACSALQLMQRSTSNSTRHSGLNNVVDCLLPDA